MSKLIKRDDGRYQRCVYLGMKDGKRKYKYVYGSNPKEVDEKIIRLKISLHKGVDISAEKDSFYTWATRWLVTKKRKLSIARYEKYKYCIENQLAALHYVPISKIKAYDIQDIINDLSNENPHTKKPSSEKTLKDILSVIRQIFSIAIKNRVIDFNPCDAVEIPAERSEPTRRALTDEEQQWILETPHRAQKAAMIMMLAGLRRGELIPLTWGDVDFDNKTIDVNKSVIMVKGKSVLQDGKAKTAGSIRTIDIPDILVDFLRNEKPQNASSDDLICLSARGCIISDSGWKRMWSSYLSDLNFKYGGIPEGVKSKHDPNGVPFLIPNITAHWLRHTFITNMYVSGVDVLTAKEQAGHADIKTTLEIYTHLDAKFKRKNMDKLNEYFKSRNKKDILD